MEGLAFFGLVWVLGFGIKVWGLRFRTGVSGLGFLAMGLGFGV